jgi:GT2 family glycosyltransferase
MIRGFESDPSQILIDYYTEAQTKAQAILDSKFRELKPLTGELLVIIPFKDRWDLTSTCLQTLNDQIIPRDLTLRVVLVDNGSVMSETAQGIKGASECYPHLKIENLRADYPFNFSKLNNDAFKAFRTEKNNWVLFLNNDVSLNDQTIVSRMASCLESVPEAGAVGCTLLYPDRRIQHLFAAPGVKIIAAHPLKGVPYNQDFAWFQKPARPVAAVTGAVMMLRATDFGAVGRFDETLATMAQDIVISCLVSEKLLKFNVSLHTNNVFHQESPTKSEQFSKKELRHVHARYSKYIFSERYFSRNLSRWSERPAQIVICEARYPAEWVI